MEEASEPWVSQKKEGNHAEGHLVPASTASGPEGLVDSWSLTSAPKQNLGEDHAVEPQREEDSELTWFPGEGGNLKLPLP